MVSTIKTSLKSICSPENILLLKDKIDIVNKTTILTYQFYKLYILYCYDNNILFPTLNDDLYKMILKIVSIENNKTGGRPVTKNKDLVNNLKSFYELNKDIFNDYRQTYNNFSNCYKYICKSLKTCQSNNISMYYIKHIDLFIKTYINYNKLLCINDKFLYSKDTNKYILRQVRNYILKDTKIDKLLVNNSDINDKIKEKLNNFITNISNKLKEHKQLYSNDILNNKLYNMIYFTKQIELLIEENKDNNKEDIKLYNVFCQRNNIVPKYIPIDSEIIKEFYIEPKLWKQYKINNSNNNDKDKIFAVLFDKLYNIDSKIYKSILNNKQKKFNYLIYTDGVACSISMINNNMNKSFGCFKGKKETEYIEPIKYINELNNEELNNLKHKNLVGIDPGINNILTCIDENRNKLRYTQKQRYNEICFTKKQKFIEHLKTSNIIYKDCKNIIEIETILSNYNLKTLNYNNYIEAIKVKNEINKVLYNFYSQYEFRHERWKSYIKTQKSESKLINNIKNTYGSKCILLYGNWERTSTMKYNKPTPRVGLKNKLLKHFTMYNIDEYKTSKTCFHCHNETEKFKQMEKISKTFDIYNDYKLITKKCQIKNNKITYIREKEDKKADEEILKSYTLHGLLRCKNVSCLNNSCDKYRIFNRDINGALNILKVGKNWIKKKREHPIFTRKKNH